MSPPWQAASGATSTDGFLLSLYGCVTGDDALPRMVGLLAELFRCNSGAFVYADRFRPEADVVVGHGVFDAEAQRIYAERFVHLDPMPSLMARLPIGEVAASDRLFPPDEIAAMPFIREYFHPLGLREAMGGPVVNHGGQFGVMAVHRGPEREPFSDREIESFARLIPHLSQVVDLRRRFFEIADRADRLNAALEATATAVVVLGTDGVLSEANAAARALLDRRDGLSLSRAGRLEAGNPQANERLQAATRFAPPSRGTPAILSVPRTGEGMRYTLRVAAPGRAAERRFLVVHISDPDRPAPEPATLLSAAFGLSRLAAVLVATLLAGGDLKDFAREAGLSPDGARYHLRNAFALTDTHRQSDLVRLATGVVRDFGLPL